MDEHQIAADKAYLYNLVDSLLSAVENEIKVYRELQLVIAQESQVLMKPTLELIRYTSEKKGACISEIRKLEQTRLDIVQRIADFLGRKEDDINFTVLSSYADEHRRMQIESLRRILVPLIKQINEGNEKNRGLLDFSLSYVRGSIHFLTGLMSAGGGYEDTGRMRPASLDGRVLNSQG